MKVRINGQPEAVPVRTQDMATIEDSSTTPGYTYVGSAQIGSATSAAVWKLMKIKDDGTEQDKYADGNPNYDNTWDGHASYTYS